MAPVPQPHAPRARALPRSRSSAFAALSVIAPVYDEAPNLRELHRRCVDALQGVSRWELVMVDDGSRDDSAEIIRDLARLDARVRGVFLPRNQGQTAALQAGVHFACGTLIATIDADLQNDPADLIALLDALGDNDAVVGYRVQRRDNVVRRISSRVANRVRNWISVDSIRDTGCALKLFRAEPLRELFWFNGVHRFMPTLLRYHGYRVVEHPVSHHPRVAGVSKYGVRNRVWRAFIDLLAVRWMRSRIVRLPGVAVRDSRTRLEHANEH